MPVKRDSQRSKVYAFEGEHIFRGTPAAESISAREAVDLITKVWRRYGVGKPPKVNFKPGWGAGSASWYVINLKVLRRDGVPQGLTRALVLHELSHSLTHLVDSSCGHGPEFVGMFLDLLRLYTDCDVSAIKRAAKELPAGRRIKVKMSWKAASVRTSLKSRYRFNGMVEEAQKMTPVVTGIDLDAPGASYHPTNIYSLRLKGYTNKRGIKAIAIIRKIVEQRPALEGRFKVNAERIALAAGTTWKNLLDEMRFLADERDESCGTVRQLEDAIGGLERFINRSKSILKPY